MPEHGFARVAAARAAERNLQPGTHPRADAARQFLCWQLSPSPFFGPSAAPSRGRGSASPSHCYETRRRTKDRSNPLQMREQKQKPKTRRESLASNHRLIVDDGRQVASDNGENETARLTRCVSVM
jgi:hypothetical protein